MTATLRQGIRLCACPMRRLLIATFLLLLLLPAGLALAGDNPSDLLIDACRDEKVDGTYSQSTYRKALQDLPADSDQYTACRDVIERARLAALDTGSTSGGSGGGGASGDSGASSASGGSGGSGGTGGGSPGGSIVGSGSASGGATAASSIPVTPPPTPAEQKALNNAITAGAAPVRVGGKLIRPGAVGRLASGGRELPTPLIGVLALLAASALAGGGVAGWNRVLARRAH